jgi:thiamine transport system substrate-binding protein
MLYKWLFSFFIISLAFAEPTLTIYTSETFAQGVGKSLKEQFEAKAKVKVQYVTCNGAASTLADILKQKRKADGIIGLSYELLGASKIKEVLTDHLLEETKLSLPFDWKEKKLIPLFYSALSLVYNREEFKGSIESFEDLLKVDRKIILIDPRTSHAGFGLLLWIKSIYGKETPQFWKKLKPKILTTCKGWSEAYALFLQGESPIVLSYQTSPAYHRLKENTSKISAFNFKEGHPLQIYIGAILSQSKQPSLMREYLSFALEPASQKKIVYEDWSFPVVDIGEELPKEFSQQVSYIEPLDPDTIEKYKSEWLNEWLDSTV